MRNKDGTWAKGTSGNPNGRPEGIDFVAILKRKLGEIPEGYDRNRAEQIADIMLDEAIEQKDRTMIRDVIDRVAGRPTETINQTILNLPEVIEIDLDED